MANEKNTPTSTLNTVKEKATGFATSVKDRVKNSTPAERKAAAVGAIGTVVLYGTIRLIGRVFNRKSK